METPRSVDLDGLDGIIPSPDKLNSKSFGLIAIGAVLFMVLAVIILVFMQKQRSSPLTSTQAPAQKAETAIADPSKIPQEPAKGESTASVEKTAPTVANIVSVPANSETPVKANPDQARQAPAIQASVAENHPVVPSLPAEPTAAGNANNKTANNALFTVYFKLNSSTPISLSAAETRHLIDLANSCPKRIGIIGHTCNLGSDVGNLRLGRTRANAVKKLLIANGITARLIEVASEGSSKPVAPNDTPAGQASNRRAVLSCLDQ